MTLNNFRAKTFVCLREFAGCRMACPTASVGLGKQPVRGRRISRTKRSHYATEKRRCASQPWHPSCAPASTTRPHSRVGVLWEFAYRDLNYPHQIAALPGCQRSPNREVMVYRCGLGLCVGPGVFRVWPVIGKIRREAFQIVGNRQRGANPRLEVGESSEREQIRNSVAVALSNLPQEPQKLHEARVTFRRRRTGTPKICLRDLFRDHL